MEGARWNVDTMCIDETMNRQFYDCMPIILLEPTKRSEIQSDEKFTYETPVYRTSSRQSVTTKSGHLGNFVMFLDLHSQEQAVHWMFRGVALLCQLND